MKLRQLWLSVALLMSVFGISVLIARSSDESANANLLVVLILFVGSFVSGLVAGRTDRDRALRNGGQVTGSVTLLFLIASVALRASRDEPLRIGNAIVLFMVLTSLGVAGAAVAKKRAATQA